MIRRKAQISFDQVDAAGSISSSTAGPTNAFISSPSITKAASRNGEGRRFRNECGLHARRLSVNASTSQRDLKDFMWSAWPDGLVGLRQPMLDKYSFGGWPG